MTSTCTYVDLYLRLSDGRDLKSLAARERKLRREAQERDWTVRKVVRENDVTANGRRNASAFKTKKVTGPDGRTVRRVVRVGFDEILDDLWSGQADALLVEDGDRIARDPTDGQRLLDVAREKKISVDSLTGSGKLTKGGTNTEQYNFQQTVLNAWKASVDTAQRVRNARERQADEGIWGGGLRPYGFTPVPHPDGKYRNTQLAWNDHEVKVIQDMADRFLSGQSLRSIAADLREAGEPTVTGAPWTPEMVRDILSRRLNMARMTRLGKDIGPASFEPLFTKKQWDRLTHRFSLLAEGQRKHGPAANRLLSGVAQCPCGQTLEAGPRETYVCKALRNGPGGGGHVRRRYAELDAYVARTVVEYLSDLDTFRLHTAARNNRPEVDVEALAAEAKEIRGLLEDLGTDYAKRLITREVMRAGSARLQAELNAIESKLDEGVQVSAVTRLTAPVNKTNTAHLGNTAERWAKLSFGEKRAIIKELATVTVLPMGDVKQETHEHYDKVCEAYLNGASLKNAAKQCGVTYREARDRIVKAKIPMRDIHAFNPNAVSINWN